MVKNLEDINLLPTFENNYNLKFMEFSFSKFKICFKIKEIQESFNTCKWGVMCIDICSKFLVHDTRKKKT